MTAGVPVSISGPRYHPHLHAEGVDVEALAADLRRSVRGDVRFDTAGRALYSTDSSNFRQVPLGVVVPLDVDDAVAAVAACRRHGAPITSRGGGTSLAGQTTNVAVVIDWSKHVNRIVELNAEERWARVQPGLVLDTLRDAAEEHGLTFGPDPSTHNRCTLGGMIGNNSCGAHSVIGGRTSDNVLELEVLLYDGTRLRVGPTSDDELERIVAGGGREGEIYAALRDLRDGYAERIRATFPDIPRRVSGFGLNELLPERGCNVGAALTGSEGTCVLVLEAKVRLVPSPPARALVVLGYPSIAEAADHVPTVMRHGPVALEAIDDVLLDDMCKKHLRLEDVSLLPDGKGFLMVELGADDQEGADRRAREMMDALRDGPVVPTMALFDDRRQEAELWAVREAGLGATARVPDAPDAWPGWEDAAVDVEHLGDYLRDFRALLDRYELHAALYGHFSQGCVHCRISFDLATADGVEHYRRFLADAADLVVRYGGSLSGEHGDGQQRGPLLERMYGDEIVRACTEFKAIWDPDDRMNPGKVVDPIRRFDLDENLRIGARYRPWQPETHFAFPDDGGSFDRAVLRCVGVGLCRRDEGGTMCPSFMATHEEEHSTRGRSRLLFEMLEGEVVTDGWRSDAVAEALDLCLSCKGCKHDCPVNVDMATYKAEFLAHHHARRLRPRAAYSLGLIMFTARLASRAPRLANALTSAPGIGRALKRLGGVTTERPAPRFAATTFVDWFTSRPRPAGTGRPRVVLYPDTFTNYFEPDQGAAAVEVLEAAGFEVAVPDRPVCCGRPLYDYGMLPTAKRFLRRNLDVLREELVAGTPIVVLEPSCAAVFRDELGNLLPHDHDAMRLARQARTLAELLTERDVDVPSVDRDLLVWQHCHHRAVLDPSADAALLDRTGARWEVLEGTCCGLAGSWGFEAPKYELSMQIGELGLFPAVRDAAPGTVLVADGFSCRNQLSHGTSRRALHLSQVLRAHLDGGLPDPRPVP